MKLNLPNMTPTTLREEEIIEKLAAIEHERWADWQKYMHAKGTISLLGGNLVFDKEIIERWQRQIDTNYHGLSEGEKQSDREQVMRYWPIIKDLLSERDSLESLIEKCGNQFYILQREITGTWLCYNTDNSAVSYPTPHEAVTKLLESLNKKENE